MYSLATYHFTLKGWMDMSGWGWPTYTDIGSAEMEIARLKTVYPDKYFVIIKDHDLSKHALSNRA